MYRRDIDSVVPGMVIAKTIYSERGDVLVAAGVELTPGYIESLKRRGTPALLIRDGLADDVIPEEVVTEKLRTKVTAGVTAMFDAVVAASAGSNASAADRPRTVDHLTNRLNATGRDEATDVAVEKLYGDVEALLAEVMSGDPVGGLTSLKTHSAYTFQHSVDVAVLGIVLGKRIDLPLEQLRELALGCLLHDIGKTYIQESILDKPAKLSPAEFEEIKKHPLMGFELIRQMQLQSILPAHVSYQHHERQDGAGYPKGLRGSNRIARTSAERYDPERMLLIAELAAVADVYSALTSDRPYRAAMPLDQVADTLRGMAGRHLNGEVVRLLMNTVPVFPIGHWVEVRTGPYTGWRGVVTEVHPHALDRPDVRLLLNSHRESVPTPVELDLRRDEDLLLSSLPTGAAPTDP